MTIAVSTWIAAGAIAVAVGLAGVQTVRLAGEKSDHATTRAGYADERTKAAQAHARAADEQRAIYESRIQGKENAIAVAKQLAANRAATIGELERAGNGLRDDLAAYIARSSQAGGGTIAGSGGSTASPAAGMLGQLFAEADSFAGVLGGAFAAARSAGLTCEASYDALTTR